MSRELKSIPQPTRDIPPTIVRVLAPIRDALERRFMSNDGGRVITREDLQRLGLATDEQLRALDRR